jgi:hypothetical protein
LGKRAKNPDFFAFQPSDWIAHSNFVTRCSNKGCVPRAASREADVGFPLTTDSEENSRSTRKNKNNLQSK